MGSVSKHPPGPSGRFPFWGAMLAGIAGLGLILLITGIRSFLTLKAEMEAGGQNVLELLGTLFVFSSVGAMALGQAILGALMLIIALPLSVYFYRRGI
jgi:hypothetical protein